MFAFTPAPVHATPCARRPPASALCSDFDYLDAVAERAAQDYAAATARLQAIERQREQAQLLRYLQEVSQRQAALDNYYHEQSRLIATSVRPQALVPARPTPSFAIEELVCGVRREAERRRVLLSRQREAQQARALAEARQRQEAEQRLRLRIEAQRAREQEAFLALFGLTDAISQDAGPVQQSRAPAYYRQRVPIPLRTAQMPTPVEIPEKPLGVAEDDLYAALQGYLSQLAAPSEPPKPADRKGKGKAVDVPSHVAAPYPAHQQHQDIPSFKEELETRMRNETDPEVQEALVKLYCDIFDDLHPRETQSVAGPSTSTRGSKPPPASSSSAPAPQTTPTAPEPAKPAYTEGADLHRTHALPPAVAEKILKFYHARRARKLSLTQIAAVEDALRKLEATFEFPSQLDFVNPLPSDADEPGALAYTPNNTPVHTYEHALNGLLTQLDAVESNGDLAVRGRRKEVVREVERALEAVERRVEESRERERERSRERRRSAASSPAPSVTTADVEDAVPVKGEVKAEVNIEAPVEATLVPAVTSDVSDTDTGFVALADTPSTDDPATAALVNIDPTSPASEIPMAVETDTVSKFPSDVPASAAISTLTSPVDSTPSPVPIVDAGISEIDAVAVELVDVAPSSSLESSPHAPVTEPSVIAVTPTPTAVGSPVVPTPDSESSESVAVDGASEPSSPVAASDATFITAPSTFPPTSVPTPEAITRATSSTTDGTFITANSGSSTPSPADAVPEAMTRTPSEASSAASEMFLLSSTPLADGPKRKQQQAKSEDDEPEMINKDEVDAKSDSEWSDVDAA